MSEKPLLRWPELWTELVAGLALLGLVVCAALGFRGSMFGPAEILSVVLGTLFL